MYVRGHIAHYVFKASLTTGYVVLSNLVLGDKIHSFLFSSITIIYLNDMIIVLVGGHPWYSGSVPGWI